MDAQQLGSWLRRPGTVAQFRLEVLQTYEVASDGSDYRRYLDGAPSWTPERKEPLLKRLREEKAAGLWRHRVRIVERPVTPYTRYECEWGYAPNVEAGEDVRILDVEERIVPPVQFTESDWWLCTDEDGRSRVAEMVYDEAFQFVEAIEVDPDLVPVYVDTRSALWGVAEPFAPWWARNVDLHRGARRAA